MAEEDKARFTLGFPTLVGEQSEGAVDEATLIQTRGPWSLGGAQTFDASLSGGSSDDLLNLPALPELPAPKSRLEAPKSSDKPPRMSTATALRPSVESEAGRIVGGRYAIEARIGEGGMGRVYRVKHVGLGKTFALKIMSSLLADDESARRAFFREAQLASSLSHPQIVSIVDFGEDPEFGVYMVMELLEGEQLKQTLHERGQFAMRPACDIMLQAADAIRYVHEKGVVHCDIKAENVLLTSERSETGRRNHRVKLLDFGLARPHTNADRSKTLSGTPAYLAPERIRGAAPAPSMDIYALGILFYELLTGAPPFSGSIDTVLYHHVNEPPRSPSAALGSPIDDRVEALILKALAKRPEERQLTVGAFIYELRTTMEMMGFGTRRRTVPRPAKAAANDLVDALFADCPLPLAAFASDGTILVGNKAFSVFVCGEAADLRGVTLAETSMCRACPGITHHIRTVMAEGRPLQIDMKTPNETGQAAKLLVWLTPGPAEADYVFCAVHVVG